MNGGVTIRVNLPEKSYEISVRPGLLAEIGQWLKNRLGSAKAAVVSDSNVAATHGKTVVDSLMAAGVEPLVATLPAGEKYKNLQHLMPVYDQLLAAKIERTTPIFAVGGGVVGDMTGFVAATILRGVPLVQVPTTLLSMVDASIGGKTGVDHAVGKNLIGAFYQPASVLIDPETLRTLPPRELRSGLAECIKHDLIRDADGLKRLEQDIEQIMALEMSALSELIAHNVRIKAKVVESDPFEKGERAHLNFGHTFGHAIESVSNFSYAHGEAISLGMTAAAYVSCKLGMIDETSRLRIVTILQKAGLPTTGLTLDGQTIVESMKFDKKVKDGRIRFVLLQRIGQATVRDDVSPELVREALESLRR